MNFYQCASSSGGNNWGEKYYHTWIFKFLDTVKNIFRQFLEPLGLYQRLEMKDFRKGVQGSLKIIFIAILLSQPYMKNDF